jgi:hypothetical protein
LIAPQYAALAQAALQAAKLAGLFRCVRSKFACRRNRNVAVVGIKGADDVDEKDATSIVGKRQSRRANGDNVDDDADNVDDDGGESSGRSKRRTAADAAGNHVSLNLTNEYLICDNNRRDGALGVGDARHARARRPASQLIDVARFANKLKRRKKDVYGYLSFKVRALWYIQKATKQWTNNEPETSVFQVEQFLFSCFHWLTAVCSRARCTSVNEPQTP